MQCLQLAMDFIRSLGHWGQDPEAEPLLPPIDRVSPPPDTILTAPKRRPQPLGYGTARSSTSSFGGFTDAGQSPSVAKQSLERLKRNDTITSTFSSRMKPLRTSQPPTPTTAQSRHFPTNQRTTSSATIPSTRLRLPMPPFPFSTIDTQQSSPEELEGSKTQPLPTPEATHSRHITFPVQMARSVSEPQGMSDMAGFAAHQMVRSRSGSVSVARARMINRPRAATATTSAERLVNFPTHLAFYETRRGRSPGPRSAGLGSGRPSPLGSGTDIRPVLSARSTSNGILNAAPDVPVDVEPESNDEEVPVSEEGEEGVVRRDLGLRGVFPSQKGRRRGRPGKGRAKTH